VLKIRDQEVQEYKDFNNIKRSIRSRVSRVSDQEIPDYQEIKNNRQKRLAIAQQLTAAELAPIPPLGDSTLLEESI